MQNVRLHVAGNGVTWVISRCRVCGEVSKHLISDAVAGTIACGKCGRQVDMRGATIDAVAALDTQAGEPKVSGT
jgi:hypothetical protein